MKRMDLEKAPIERDMINGQKNTTVVASDSMLSNLGEKRLCKNYYNVKVHYFRGSTIHDMYHYLEALMRKETDYIVLHVSTNDYANLTSDKILAELLVLK